MAPKTRQHSSGSKLRLKKLQARLDELEQTIQAIRAGEVDAVVVSGQGGDRVFTLEGADHAYRVLVEAINEGAATLNASGLILYANNRFAEMVKLPLTRLIGSHLRSIVEPAEAAALDKLIASARKSPQKKEFTIVLPEAATLSAHLSLSPLKGADFQGICMVVTDLTEQKRRQEELAQANRVLEAEIAVRKRAEHAVRQAEEVFQAFMNYTPAAVLIQDEAGRYVFCNRRAQELVGFEHHSLMGKSPADWLPGKAGELFQERDRAALRSLAPTEHIEIIPSENGRPSELLMARFPFQDSSGRKLLGVVGVDITPQRHAEASLRKLTARLINLRDEEQRRIARDLHDSTAQTLAALAMNLNMLQDHRELPPSPNVRRLLTNSADLADAASKEVRNLAHLLHPPDLDVMGLSAAIRWHIARTFEPTGINVELKLPENVGRLPKEIETALFRVLQESLENVRRHSGSTVARVRLRRNTKHIVLEVEDEGGGILTGTLKKDDYSAAGAGVGVAGMHERLNHLGGTLEIESGKRGTTVRASVPLSSAQTPTTSR